MNCSRNHEPTTNREQISICYENYPISVTGLMSHKTDKTQRLCAMEPTLNDS